MKGLESIIDIYQLHIVMGPDGWYFSGEGDALPEDPLHGFKTLKQLYHLADPDFSGRYTVPVLWDKKSNTIVNNESSEIIRMFYTEFDELLPEHLRETNKPTGGLYPENLRKDIDQVNDWVYNTINNGVYKVGFATTQEAYDKNIHPLFQSLDRVESMLGHGRKYLFGDHITEADVRLYTTLIRFDVAYHTVFMCNLKSIRHDYPLLYLWLRRLYWDQDEDGEARAAFYLTTSPYIGQYSYGYAASRKKIIYKDEGSLIIPAGPAILIDPLP
jgi:putative glutathione S-transferase